MKEDKQRAMAFIRTVKYLLTLKRMQGKELFMSFQLRTDIFNLVDRYEDLWR